MPVDRRLIRPKIALILEDMKDVERLVQVDRSEFLGDRVHQLVAERPYEALGDALSNVPRYLEAVEATLALRDPGLGSLPGVGAGAPSPQAL